MTTRKTKKRISRKGVSRFCVIAPHAFRRTYFDNLKEAETHAANLIAGRKEDSDFPANMPEWQRDKYRKANPPERLFLVEVKRVVSKTPPPPPPPVDVRIPHDFDFPPA